MNTNEIDNSSIWTTDFSAADRRKSIKKITREVDHELFLPTHTNSGNRSPEGSGLNLAKRLLSLLTKGSLGHVMTSHDQSTNEYS